MPFYAVEGVDGSGKTTLVAALAGTGVFTVKTPPLGFKPSLHELQLQYPTDISLSLRYTIPGLRATGEQIAEILRPDAGRTVVSDRYLIGTLVNLLAIDQIYHGDWKPRIFEAAFMAAREDTQARRLLLAQDGSGGTEEEGRAEGRLRSL